MAKQQKPSQKDITEHDRKPIRRRIAALEGMQAVAPAATAPAPPAETYAAFLFIPGREWVLYGDFHVTVEAAQAALAEQLAKNPTAAQAWVVRVITKGCCQQAVTWQ